MLISDLIRSKNDRVFIVDPECYIIFTGYSVEDEKPFIRIGTWKNLPPELIPLIENIIIPDSVTGDPSIEQFNIDTGCLDSNRYIGGSEAIEKFLEFQGIFGINLNSASIVNIEKDIPELSSEKSIFGNNNFTGVFYRNGNFKTTLDGEEIFDLEKTRSLSFNHDRVHHHISLSASAERYRRSGFVLCGKHPLLYSRGRFISYLFPENYYEDFSALGIDPGKISAIIYPSSNMANLSRFMKWLNANQGTVEIFCDSAVEIQALKKLFSRASVYVKPYSGLKLFPNPDLSIKSSDGAGSLCVELSGLHPSIQTLSIIFLNDESGAEKAVRDRPSLIISPYSIYTKCALLFKASQIPVFVIPDDNDDLKKLSSMGLAVLHPGFQYEFLAPDDLRATLSSFRIGAEDAEALLSGSAAVPEALWGADPADEEAGISRFNLLSAAEAVLSGHRDRAASSALRQFIEKNRYSRDLSVFRGTRSSLIISLVFINAGVFQFISKTESREPSLILDDVPPVQNPGSFPYEKLPLISQEQLTFLNRIINDRIRLKNLLRLYPEKLKADSLTALMQNRKKMHSGFSGGSPPADDASQKAAPLTGPGPSKGRHEVPASFSAGRKIGKTRKKPLAAFIASGIAAAALIFIIYSLATSDSVPSATVQNDLASEKAENVRVLNQQHSKSIKISPLDIYLYANRVALKNGYSRIDYKTFGRKNPHWIYPGNRFSLLDGETVHVVKGDTLWHISGKKLIELSSRFIDLAQKTEEAAEKPLRRALLKEAGLYAHTIKDKKTLASLKRKFADAE